MKDAAYRKALWSAIEKYHNVNGPSPTVADALRFAFDSKYNPRVVAGRIDSTCVVVMTSHGIEHITGTIAQLDATGWAFEVERGENYFSPQSIRVLSTL